MKRFLAAVLFIGMLLSAAGAFAFNSLDFTMDEKLSLQTRKSGYIAEGQISVTGEDIVLPLTGGNLSLKALDGCHFTLDGSGEKNMTYNMFTLSLDRDGKQTDQLSYQRISDVLTLNGTCLPEGIYGVRQDSIVFLLADTAGIPYELLLPLYLKNGQDAGLFADLADYEEELGIWLSDYCEIQTGQDGSTLFYRVPAKALCDQAAYLMEGILADTGVQKVLSDFAASSPAFGELMKAGGLRMLPQLLRMMNPEGDITVTRVFDISAAEKTTQIFLPLDQVTGKKSLQWDMIPGENGMVHRLILEGADGEEWSLEYGQTGKNMTGGTLRARGTAGKDTAFSFACGMESGKINDDLVNKEASQDLTYRLTVTPEEGSSVHSLCAECVLHCKSGRNKSDKLYVQGEAVLRDDTSKGSVTVLFSGETKKAYAFDKLNESDVTRFEDMDIRDVVTLLQNIQFH